jgi:hypothetical protein
MLTYNVWALILYRTSGDEDSVEVIGIFDDEDDAYAHQDRLNANRKIAADAYFVLGYPLNTIRGYDIWNKEQLHPSPLNDELLYYRFNFYDYCDTGTWSDREYLHPTKVRQPKDIHTRYIAAETEEEALAAWKYYMERNPVLASMLELGNDSA